MARGQQEQTHREETRLAERAVRSRAWVGRQVRERPVATGLGLMALGFFSAALIPSSRAERRGLAQTSDTVKDLSEQFDVPGRLEEVLQRAQEFAALQLAAAVGGEHVLHDVDVDVDLDEEPKRQTRRSRSARHRH